MKRVILILAAAAVAVGCGTTGHPRGVDKAWKSLEADFLECAAVGPLEDGAFVVATTQIVSPAGQTVLFPGRPVDLALSPDGKTLAVKSRRELVLIDMDTLLPKQTLPTEKEGTSFHGIAWSEDGQRVWLTSAGRFLWSAKKGEDGAFVWADEIVLPGPKGDTPSAPGGFFLDEQRGFAYVALSRNNAVGVVDLRAGRVVAEIPVGIAPYDVLPHGDKAYVTNWGGRRSRPGDLTGPTSDSEAVIDEAGIASTGAVTVIHPADQRVVAEIAVDLHPSGMAISPDGGRLYVANANSDTVSVIDTATLKVIGRWGTKPIPEIPFGSAPNALAVSLDGTTLYAANGGNNCIAVLETDTGAVRGLIPTGWYPGQVLLTPDGAMLCIVNTKGVGSRAKSSRPEWQRRGPGEEAPAYNSHDHLGSVSFVPVPNPDELEEYTYRVAVQMRLPLMRRLLHRKDVARRTVPVPTRPGEVSVFKHVLYIIKENRTYDQVFGGLPQGNGDPSLCHFGRDVTPNHHALAEEFVLLDNFYCNGILSADGHQWTTKGT